MPYRILVYDWAMRGIMTSKSLALRHDIEQRDYFFLLGYVTLRIVKQLARCAPVLWPLLFSRFGRIVARAF